MSPAPLSRRFFARESQVVARALLGKLLVVGEQRAIIVETEAYVGPEDLASHSRHGVTGRNRVMFGPAGHAYVYFIYGMYDMFNVVTGREGSGQAVLVRAVEVPDHPARTGRGPGVLTRYLGITRRDNSIDLTGGGRIAVARGRRVPGDQIASGPRIGVDYAGQWAERPLRFWIADHPAVSGRPRPRRG